VSGTEVPVPGHGTIHDAVIADIEARRVQGEREYGRPHRLFNGFDGLREAYEELLDMACWLRQEIEERAVKRGEQP
jgi:tagatose-1,6-bisphosphate aldolase non-catalytic subunit AgaZ/GatZ